MFLVGIEARQGAVGLLVNGEVAHLGRVIDWLDLAILGDALAAQLASDVDGAGGVFGWEIHVVIVGHHIGPADGRMVQADGIGPWVFVVADAEALVFLKETGPVHGENRPPFSNRCRAVVEGGVVVGNFIDDVARAVAGGVRLATNAGGHDLRWTVVLMGFWIQRGDHANGDFFPAQVPAGRPGAGAVAEHEHGPPVRSGLSEAGNRADLVHLGGVLLGEGLPEEIPAVSGRGIQIDREG